MQELLLESVTKIIYHHSDSNDGYGSDFEAIKDWHVNHNGWDDIGYHKVIELVNGVYVEKDGRALNQVGAHAQGQNYCSWGVCLVGDFTENEPTKEAYEALAKCTIGLWEHRGAKIPLKRHDNYNNTSCPAKLNVDAVLRYMDMQTHWCQKYFDYLQSIGLGIKETRFDSPITRGEYFSLLARYDQLKNK